MSQLVSVIVPAYNAAETIDRTLGSVRAQTWRELDIIVVNDGSSDATSQYVIAHCKADPRVRLIERQNGGVAAARNLGIEEARGELIAPIDADDLWRPDKIEKQLAVMAAGGSRLGLVYCWFAIIDAADRVMELSQRHMDTGNVLHRMCLGNLVGNGSAPLMRREAVIAAGGYDPGLKARQAQGCEDLKLYFGIAERYEFGLADDFLLGYRWTEENMSSDGHQMLRSYDLVMNPHRQCYPEYHDDFSRGRAHMLEWLFLRAIRYGRMNSARSLFAEFWRECPADAPRVLSRAARQFVRHRLLSGHETARPQFLERA